MWSRRSCGVTECDGRTDRTASIAFGSQWLNSACWTNGVCSKPAQTTAALSSRLSARKARPFSPTLVATSECCKTGPRCFRVARPLSEAPEMPDGPFVTPLTAPMFYACARTRCLCHMSRRSAAAKARALFLRAMHRVVLTARLALRSPVRQLRRKAVG